MKNLCFSEIYPSFLINCLEVPRELKVLGKNLHTRAAFFKKQRKKRPKEHTVHAEHQNQHYEQGKPLTRKWSFEMCCVRAFTLLLSILQTLEMFVS